MKVNDDVLLEIAEKLDPVSLKELIVANKAMSEFYSTHSRYIWRSYIIRDFGLLYKALNIDLKSMGEPNPETYQACFTKALNSFRALGVHRNETLGSEARNSIVNLAFDQFMMLPKRLIDSISRPIWGDLCRFTVLWRPDLLQKLIDLRPTLFYKAFKMAGSKDTFEFTSIVIKFISSMSNTGLIDRLPFIYDAFVNPTEHNPKGIFNDGYCDYTKFHLFDEMSRWQDLVPLVGERR